ncbi:hypothetical protein VZT92_003264 [Zoarces viviparus]|uniref:Uncharacterized protein n=1 Tax=Zoarces viviparus TaxID=48416 RepID=A0AAW1G2N2_ZOAVI
MQQQQQVSRRSAATRSAALTLGAHSSTRAPRGHARTHTHTKRPLNPRVLGGGVCGECPRRRGAIPSSPLCVRVAPARGAAQVSVSIVAKACAKSSGAKQRAQGGGGR